VSGPSAVPSVRSRGVVRNCRSAGRAGRVPDRNPHNRRFDRRGIKLPSQCPDSETDPTVAPRHSAGGDAAADLRTESEIKTTMKPPNAEIIGAARAGCLLIIAATAAALAGCASDSDSHLVTAPPPTAPVVAQTTTVAQPATVTTVPAVTAAPAQTSTVIVTQAPPAVQQENPPPRPSDEYTWIGGYWIWRDNQYLWVAGHWALPPSRGAVWVPPRWEQEGANYRFYDGHWE